MTTFDLAMDDLNAAAGFHDGDVAAFDWLAARYLHKAGRVAAAILRDVDDAEDVAHEAFVRAWTQRADLLPGRGFAPWFFRIVRNLALDQLRRRGRIVNEPLDAQRLTSRGAQPDVAAHGRIVGSRIRLALRELPPQQRRVAALFFLDGCAHAEIAETLSLAEGTVRAHLSFARKRLRRVLAELEPNAA
jgi:RNA polymerase sigma-70 factor (ECF subfamily)